MTSSVSTYNNSIEISLKKQKQKQKTKNIKQTSKNDNEKVWLN
jgi:hypothetical protein